MKKIGQFLLVAMMFIGAMPQLAFADILVITKADILSQANGGKKYADFMFINRFIEHDKNIPLAENPEKFIIPQQAIIPQQNPQPSPKTAEQIPTQPQDGKVIVIQKKCLMFC